MFLNKLTDKVSTVVRGTPAGKLIYLLQIQFVSYGFQDRKGNVDNTHHYSQGNNDEGLFVMTCLFAQPKQTRLLILSPGTDIY